jgi:hypothetical protein
VPPRGTKTLTASALVQCWGRFGLSDPPAHVGGFSATITPGSVVGRRASRGVCDRARSGLSIVSLGHRRRSCLLKLRRHYDCGWHEVWEIRFPMPELRKIRKVSLRGMNDTPESLPVPSASSAAAPQCRIYVARNYRTGFRSWRIEWLQRLQAKLTRAWRSTRGRTKPYGRLRRRAP